MKFIGLSFLLASLAAPVLSQDTCSTTWTCHPTPTPPSLDADHSDWDSVNAYTTTLVNTAGKEWDAGKASYKCLYDSEQIYFALEIPGEYRFNSTNNKMCAAIGTMFKIGEKASYLNMGGCPDAMAGCPDGVPETCDDYRVDIGAHWELSGTQQGVMYEMAGSATDRQASDEPGGNDLIANKDDEYAVSSFCRFDDDDANAGNEWSGAWAHSNPIEGEFGNYHFEVSRLLKTPSNLTDAQLTPGETIQFGIAFWDPYEVEGTGWTDIGHFVTGCGTKWIDLELSTEPQPAVVPDTADEPAGDEPANIEEADPDASSGLKASMSLALLFSVFAALN